MNEAVQIIAESTGMPPGVARIVWGYAEELCDCLEYWRHHRCPAWRQGRVQNYCQVCDVAYTSAEHDHPQYCARCVHTHVQCDNCAHHVLRQTGIVWPLCASCRL